MIFDFSCDIGHVKLAVGPELWDATHFDGQASTVVTRFLHNKPLYFANNLLRCYLSYLSPDFLTTTFTLMGLILFCLGLWYLLTRKKWLLVALILIAPLSPLTDIPESGLAQTAILYSVLIGTMIFGIVNIIQWFRRR